MSKPQPWTLWKSSNGDVILTALDFTTYDGELVFIPCGKVIARHSYAGQIKKDFSASRSKARVTKKPQGKCDKTGVEMEDDYRLVDNLMRMNELGYDFGEYEYGKHPHEAQGERALGFTRKAAWKLVGMLARGESEGLVHLAKLIEMRKAIQNPQRDQNKELAELAQDIATAAENKLAKTAVIQPPTVAEVLAVRTARLPINRQEEPTDTRRKLCDAGFGWLPKKWQRKT